MSKDKELSKSYFRKFKEIPGYSSFLAGPNGEIYNKKTKNWTMGGIAGIYRKVKVYKDGEEEPILQYAHILVCLAFHGESKKGDVVLHLDNDPTNNIESNLQWGSQSKNIKQMWKDGSRTKVSKESLDDSLDSCSISITPLSSIW